MTTEEGKLWAREYLRLSKLEANTELAAENARLKTQLAAKNQVKTKKIEWAYPTSPSADKFRFAKGCWVVQTVEGHAPPVALAGYADREDAVKHAEKLPEPWNKLWLTFHPETQTK